MNPRNQKYIQDIYKHIESVPFGKFEIKVERVKGNTVSIDATSVETIRYVDNQEAIDDFVSMINQLVEASFSGQAHIKLDMNDGNIKLIGIFDEKHIKY